MKVMRSADSEKSFLTSGINDVDQRGLPVSEQAVSARVEQLQLEALCFGLHLLRTSVNHDVLLRLPRSELDRAG